MTVNESFVAKLSGALQGLGLKPTPGQISTLGQHFDLLIEANARFNLTRITDPAEAAVRLYADSAAVLVWAARAKARITSVLDVGTGAGFPAVPLAVLAPDWRVTALEATGKKAAFVEQATRALELANLRALHAHSDHWPAEATFDLVTFKAIGPLERCLNTAGGFVARGGYVAIFKTSTVPPSEVQAARKRARRVGLTPVEAFAYQLPTADSPAMFALHIFTREGQAKKP